MRELRRSAGYTQAGLATEIGLSRKTINEAEALGEGMIERRTDFAVRAITKAGKVRALLREEANRLKTAGDPEEAYIFDQASILIAGNFVTDEKTIQNLALTAARLRRRVEKLELGFDRS